MYFCKQLFFPKRLLGKPLAIWVCSLWFLDCCWQGLNGKLSEVQILLLSSPLCSLFSVALSHSKKMSDVSFDKSPLLWKGLFCRTWALREVSKEKTEIAAAFLETNNYLSGSPACVQKWTAPSWWRGRIRAAKENELDYSTSPNFRLCVRACIYMFLKLSKGEGRRKKAALRTTEADICASAGE